MRTVYISVVEVTQSMVFAIAVQADYDSNQYIFLNEGMEGLLMSFFLVQKCHSSYSK